MTASVLPSASNAASPMIPMGAGASAGPAAAFEAMLAALFGPMDAQAAGLFAPGVNDPLASDATASDDTAADPQSASTQTQSLIAALLTVAPPPPAPNGQPSPADPDAATPGGADVAPGLVPAAGVPVAGAKFDLPFMGLGKGVEAAPDAEGSAASSPATPALTPDAINLADLQPPPVPTAKGAQIPEPPPPVAAAPLNPAQIARAAEALPTPDSEAPAGGKPDTRSARNDGPRRNAALFANPGLDTTAAPPGLAQAAQARPAHVPTAAFAAAVVAAAQADKGDASEAGIAQSAAGDAPQSHPHAVGETAAAPLTSAPAMAAPAAILRGAPETVANLAAQILKKLDGRSTRFDVELDPAGLGRVDVRLEIGAHGRMTAAMAFDNPQAAQELRSRSGELTRALEQAGFDVSGGLSFDVAGDPNQSGRGAPRDDNANENAGSALRGRAFQAALDASAEADTAPTGGLNLRRRLLAGVDIKI